MNRVAEASTLVQLVDAATAEAARRAGEWVACRPGCTQCCLDPFPITQLDALRLREGIALLTGKDKERAAEVQARARAAWERLRWSFPGDPVTGVLDEEECAGERLDDFGEGELCPALDPTTGLCDLYEHRPLTCRLFGLPVRSGDDGVGVCELCFTGATEEQIAACEVQTGTQELEAELTAEAERAAGVRGETIVAFALL
jgi:Fe-S-cluster containining protein